MKTTIAEATLSAICTHNHPDGIAGAQAAALIVFWLRDGWMDGWMDA